MQNLAGKTAIVTGGGQGVGAQYALALAAAGAAVVVNDINAANAEAIVEAIRAKGGSAIADAHNVADFEAAGALCAAATEAFGSIEILILNAGIMRPSWLHETNPRDFQDMFAVHVQGTFNVYRQAVPTMIEAGRGGTIVMTGAVIGEGQSGRVGVARGSHPMLGSYRAAKAAITTLAIHAAGELQGFGINVNAIMPGATSTEMQGHYYDKLAASGAIPVPLEAGWPEPAPVETVPPLGVYLCTDEGRKITGQTFQLHLRGLILSTGPAPTVTLLPNGEYWSTDEFGERLPGLLENPPTA